MATEDFGSGLGMRHNRYGNGMCWKWEWDTDWNGNGTWEWAIEVGPRQWGMEQTGKKLTVKWLTRLCPDQVCQLSCSSVSYWAAWVLHYVTQERGRETWSNKLRKTKLWYFLNTEIRWVGFKFEPCLFLPRRDVHEALHPLLPPFGRKYLYLLASLRC